MSTRSDDRSAATRAEARRRARMAARGELPPDDEAVDEAPAERPRGGFFGRIFPPAPPLPGRPDPLAKFNPDGPLRFVRERLFLLRQNIPAWVITGLVAFVGFFASFFFQDGILSLVGTFLLFGALIAAGWMGWQRPTLYGTTASVLAYVVSAAWIILELTSLPPDQQPPPGAVMADLTVRGLYQAGLGFLGGWYGGYLRRRQTQLNQTNQPSRRR